MAEPKRKDLSFSWEDKDGRRHTYYVRQERLDRLRLLHQQRLDEFDTEDYKNRMGYLVHLYDTGRIKGD